MMTDRLADLFETAVGMLPISRGAVAGHCSREITDYDESACDAWIGRIRCGDTDRATLFRAWYSRRTSGSWRHRPESRWVPWAPGCRSAASYGDITYPVTSPLAHHHGFRRQAKRRRVTIADAMEAVDGRSTPPGPSTWSSWVKAVVYGAAQRWTDVIDEVKGAAKWPDKFLAAAAGVAHGVAAANLGLFTEAERRLTEANASPAGEACASTIAWYLAMTRRSQGNEEAAVALLEWLQTTHPEPKVAAALKDSSFRLKTTSAEQIAARTDPWDPSTVVADTSGRETLLAEAASRA